jgi:hypothetical protein
VVDPVLCRAAISPALSGEAVRISLRDAAGNVITNTGTIVLVSLGLADTIWEWASGDKVTLDVTKAFKSVDEIYQSVFHYCPQDKFEQSSRSRRS